MNRRSFITDMLKAGVACTFLPGAGRIWKPVLTPAQRIVIPGFFYEQVLWSRCYDVAYLDYMHALTKIQFSQPNDPLSFEAKDAHCVII